MTEDLKAIFAKAAPSLLVLQGDYLGLVEVKTERTPSGGTRTTTHVVAEAVPSRWKVMADKEAEQIVAGRSTNVTVYKVTVPLGTPVTTTMTVRKDGKSYDVIQLLEGTYALETSFYVVGGV